MGRYVPRSGWAEQKTSRESCCGKTAIHHTCQPEFRRAKNCSFALRRLGQNREAKRVRRSLPVSRPLAQNASFLAFHTANLTSWLSPQNPLPVLHHTAPPHPP